jgi:hypothetical protein
MSTTPNNENNPEYKNLDQGYQQHQNTSFPSEQ